MKDIIIEANDLENITPDQQEISEDEKKLKTIWVEDSWVDLSAYSDANALQLRLESRWWGNEILKETQAKTIKKYNEILSIDPREICENVDQMLKLYSIQSATAKRYNQLLWGKDTKDAVVVPEVKPLLQKAKRKG